MFGNPLVATLILGAMVAGLYWAAHVARKKLGIGAGTVDANALRVVGKRSLEARKALYVVEIADRYILVGTAENSVSLVDHITAEEFATMVPADEDPAAGSSPLLRRFGAFGGEDAPEQQLPTVGESFSRLLARARRKQPEVGAATHSDN